MKIVACFILFLFSFFSLGVYAQNTEQRTTRLDFEDELISGDVSSPDLLLILRNKNPDYGRLLKLRDNFLPELRETRFEVVRGDND